MSRIGKKLIPIPSGTKVDVSGNTITVTGSKGTLKRDVRTEVSVHVEDSNVLVKRNGEDKMHRSLHGLYRTLINNMVVGVSDGFTKSLEMKGVGYRGVMQGSKLVLQVGYSHPVEIEPPTGIQVSMEGATKIHVNGADKELVGQLAAQIRSVRKPEPYKGKGIKYADEVIRRKAGKSGKK